MRRNVQSTICDNLHAVDLLLRSDGLMQISEDAKDRYERDDERGQQRKEGRVSIAAPTPRQCKGSARSARSVLCEVSRRRRVVGRITAGYEIRDDVY